MNAVHAITFNQEQCYFSSGCIQKITDSDYIQVFINRTEKKLAVHPCAKYDLHSVPWCSGSSRAPKKMTCRILCLKVFQLMEWARTCRYKIPGDYREIGGEPYFFFDLSVTDIFTKAITETGRVISKRLTEDTALEDGNDNYHQLSFQIVNGSVMFGYEDTPLTKEATDE